MTVDTEPVNPTHDQKHDQESLTETSKTDNGSSESREKSENITQENLNKNLKDKNTNMEFKSSTDKELIDKLLRMVKREVKQIMEEAVTRKFVHEDSSSITALCGKFF